MSSEQFIPSTPGLVRKRLDRENIIGAEAVSVHLEYLQQTFGITFEGNGRWMKYHLRAQAAQEKPPGAGYLLFYGRNSSKVGIRSSSDLRQSDEAVQICRTHRLGNVADIKIFFDYGKSGADLNRPEMDRLIEIISENWGCILMVEDIDRITRDELSLLHIGAKLAAGGVRIFTLKGEVSYEEFISLGLEAARERRKLKKRGNPLRRANIRAGAHYHRPALGLAKTSKGQVRLSAKAELVRTVFEMYLADEPLTAIGRWLAERGVKSKNGRVYRSNEVRHILTREIYIGIVRTEFETGEVVRTVRPELQIIDPAVFAAAQAKLNAKAQQRVDAKASRSASAHAPPSAPPPSAYYLKRKFRCPRCGAPMDVNRFTYPKSVRTSIRCVANREEHACDAFEEFSYTEVEIAIMKVLASRGGGGLQCRAASLAQCRHRENRSEHRACRH